MDFVKNYKPIMIKNEEVFRNIIADLIASRLKLPRGDLIPINFRNNISLEEFWEEYSEGKRYGRFTIGNFRRPSDHLATITFFKNSAVGGGAELEYCVKPDNQVDYLRAARVF
jgi:hypothetical protein